MNAYDHQGKSPDSAFPCLNGNNCTDRSSARPSSSHRKMLYLLARSVEALFERYGRDYLGFLTLTFPGR